MKDNLFVLGHLVATPAALDALAVNNQSASEFLARHTKGDWGDLDSNDQKENQEALKNGYWLLSAYHLKNGTKIWIITEADRSVTTILLPEDY